MTGDQFIIVDLSGEFVRVWVDLGSAGIQGEVTLTAVARSKENEDDYRFTFSQDLSEWFDLSSGIIPEGWQDSVINAFEKFNTEKEPLNELVYA